MNHPCTCDDSEPFKICPEHGIQKSDKSSFNGLEIKLNQPDMRDMRDPEQVGLEYLARGNARSS
jgi:hypothetical protein